MADFEEDIFYLSSRNLSPDIWEKICREALDKCYNWWTDYLPDWTRTRINIDIEYMMDILYTDKIHFNIIHRKSFDKHLEIGFCTLDSKFVKDGKHSDVFLWILLDESHIPNFVEKYNLKLI